MTSPKKDRLLFDGLFYGLGQVSQRAIALISLPFFIQYISPADYGVVGLLSSLSIFMLPIFSLGLSFSISVCYFNSKKNEKTNVITTALFVSLISAAFFLTSTIFFIDDITILLFSTLEYKLHTLVAFITIFFSIIAIPIQLYQQYMQQSVLFLSFSLISALISVIVSFITIVFMDYEALGLLIGAMVGQALLFLLLFSTNYKIFSITAFKNLSVISELIRIGCPMIPSFFLLFMIQNAARWSLQYTDNLSMVGIFSLGASLGAIVNITASGITAAWLPWVLGQSGNWDNSMHKIGEKLLSYFTYGCLIVALFFIFSQPIAKLIAPPLYFQSWLVIGLIAASHFFISLWYMILPPLYIEKRLSVLMIAQLIATLVTLVAIFFMTNLGILGAGIACFFGSISLFISQLLVNKKFLKIRSIPINIYEYCKTFLFVSVICMMTYGININEFSQFLLIEFMLLSLLIIYFYRFNSNIFIDIKNIFFEIDYGLRNFYNEYEKVTVNDLRSKYNVLVLYDQYATHTNNVFDNLDSFKRHSKHNYQYVHAQNVTPSIIWDHFDVIVIHYSLRVAHHGLTKKFYGQIKKFSGLKIIFMQDEYENTNVVKSAIDNLGINIAYTCVPKKYIQKIYSKELSSKVKFFNVLTGYMTSHAYLKNENIKPIVKRKIKISYRGNVLPFHYGDLGQEKEIIATRMKLECKKRDIDCNISSIPEDRLYGDKWLDLLLNSKATLGTESGSNLFDFDGENKIKFTEYQLKNPNADYHTSKLSILGDYQEEKIMNQISSRIFEAIICKTALVLFEGSYSNILKPHRHFICLKKDFSNINDVFKKLLDDKYLQRLVDNTFNDIVKPEKYSYKNFISSFDENLFSEMKLAMLNKKNTHHIFKKNIYFKILYFFNFTPEDNPRKIPSLFISNRFLNNFVNSTKKYVPESIKLLTKKFILIIIRRYKENEIY